jgi:predicted DCC family thiol-disulfide oxidoreductase YuxK
MKSPILFYDGYCALCNFFVNFILRFDKKKQFYFCPLDSNLGRDIRQKYKIDSNIDSIILLDNTLIYTHHWAVFKILKKLPYPIKFLLIFSLLPSGLNKYLYTRIAQNRNKFTKRYSECPLPPFKYKDQFLY